MNENTHPGCLADKKGVNASLLVTLRIIIRRNVSLYSANVPSRIAARASSVRRMIKRRLCMDARLKYLHRSSGSCDFSNSRSCPLVQPARQVRAVAAFIDRHIAVAEFGQVDVTVFRVQAAMSGFAGRRYAVKGIRAHLRADQDVVGAGKAEQMARFVFRQLFAAPAQDLAEIFLEEGAARP